MENSFSPDIEYVDLSTTESNVGCVNERVINNILNENSNTVFLEAMTKMTFQVVEQYNGNEQHDLLLQLLDSLFLDSKPRSKLILARVRVSNTQERSSKVEDKNPELQALLGILDSRLRQNGSRGPSHAKRKTKLVGGTLPKSKRASIKKNITTKREQLN